MKDGGLRENKASVIVTRREAYDNGTQLSSYMSAWWHLLPPLINKLYMKSIPAPPGGLLPLSSSSSVLFNSFFSVSSLLRLHFFPLFCPARNRPLISSLCLSPKWEKFEPRGSREANTTLLHLPPPIPITLAFLLSVFFYPSCLTVPLSWPSDRACFITSNPLTWQSSPHSEGKIE